MKSDNVPRNVHRDWNDIEKSPNSIWFPGLFIALYAYFEQSWSPLFPIGHFDTRVYNPPQGWGSNEIPV